MATRGRPPIKFRNKLGMVLDYEDGMTAEQVAEKYGGSTRTVLKRLREWGADIRPRGWNFRGTRFCAAEEVRESERTLDRPVGNRQERVT